MSSIIKTVKIVALIVTFLFSSIIVADVTPIELKLIQTRMFEKQPSQVVQAIADMCADLDANYTIPSSALNGRSSVTCLFAMDMPKIGYFGLKVKKNQKVGTIKGVLSWDKNQESTVVRLRISMYGNKKDTWSTQKQSKDPSVYSKYFRSIADYMFVDAIEWSPPIQE